ncbi:MAG: hypothetical protein ACI4A7_02705 [Prevotella sp.]
MKKIILFFKNWVFTIRLKSAIRKAQRLADEQRHKFLVLNFNGKPTVISMRDIKMLIRTRQLKGTPDFYRDMALYTAMPKSTINNQ